MFKQLKIKFKKWNKKLKCEWITEQATTLFRLSVATIVPLVRCALMLFVFPLMLLHLNPPDSLVMSTQMMVSDMGLLARIIPANPNPVWIAPGRVTSEKHHFSKDKQKPALRLQRGTWMSLLGKETRFCLRKKPRVNYSLGVTLAGNKEFIHRQ